MPDGLYSILRFTGPNTRKYFLRYLNTHSPCHVASATEILINGNSNDILIWFSHDESDHDDHINQEYFLNKFQELGNGKVYHPDNNNLIYGASISGTVMC